MKKQLSITTKEMCRQNIIGVKVEDSTRSFNNTLGGTVTKPIRRTKYLKICWMCGSPYESHKSNTYACSQRCSNNLVYARKNGYLPPANMEQMTKEKNVKEVKQRFGYV
ncbi:MAG: hypothetical protein C0596_16015 [Marinilabiliales bacterium]|nr:MAG: hypothetical protein C0596_16015 [Marinilabiliales bacterium]